MGPSFHRSWGRVFTVHGADSAKQLPGPHTHHSCISRKLICQRYLAFSQSVQGSGIVSIIKR